jgi:hypothetical protein
MLTDTSPVWPVVDSLVIIGTRMSRSTAALLSRLVGQHQPSLHLTQDITADRDQRAKRRRRLTRFAYAYACRWCAQ